MCGAIPQRLWEKPLDFTLWATDRGELRIPFSSYVHQTQLTCLSSVTFPRFSELPAELQLRIFYFCDNPTLFQLMQTSSYVRSEAKKFLFSGADAWYYVDADWIHRGYHPGDTYHDMEFLLYIEQLEVQFLRMDEDYWLEGYHYKGDPILKFGEERREQDVAELLEERFQDFWQRLHTHFPRAARVILCENHSRTSGDLPPEIFRKLAQMCVPGIQVSLSFLKARKFRDLRVERSIWQYSNHDTDTSVNNRWSEIPAQVHSRIIPPNKPLRGPIGAHEHSRHKRDQYYFPCHTLSIMLITSMERHHFYGAHTPSKCPAPDCDTTFTRPGDFTTHINDEWPHYQHIVPPAPFQAVFSAQEKNLERLMRDWGTAAAAFRELWGEVGTERRNATVRAAIEQIERDPLYVQGKAAGESWALEWALDTLDGIV